MDTDRDLSRDEIWIRKVTATLKENLSNERFGVAELSDALAISRYQLHRKLKLLKGQSVSQFIRTLRLDEARKMLLSDVATVSEIAYRVGFGSPSYFNKCFHDYYGYPPGEVRKRAAGQKGVDLPQPVSERTSHPTFTLENPPAEVRPVRIAVRFLTAIAVVLLVFFYLYPADRQRHPSIAILPLNNLTGSHDQAYFVEGIHDALIGELGKISALRVISRTSTLRYPGRDMLLKDIARELNVDLIVEGSVYGSGDSLRLQLQLIEVFPDERHIWAQEYHEDIRKASAVQSTIAREIASEIEVSLTREEEMRIRNTRVVNQDAYRAYLRGMYYVNHTTPEEVKKGIAHLLESIKIDPADPLPWAGLAIGYSTLGHGQSPLTDAFVRAKSAAKKAVALDGDLAEAHLALAMIALYNDWDWDTAAAAFERALEINPNFAEAHTHYAWFHMLFGRENEVLKHGKKATELDPFSPLYSAYLACELWWLGRHGQALTQIEEALLLAPESGFALYVKGGIFASQGMYERAIQVHRKAAELNGWEWPLGHTYVLASRQEETFKIAGALSAKPRPMDTWGLAEIYAAMGKNNEAFMWLEECYKKRFSWIPWIEWNPNYKSLQNDSRFHELVKRLDLPAGEKAEVGP